MPLDPQFYVRLFRGLPSWDLERHYWFQGRLLGVPTERNSDKTEENAQVAIIEAAFDSSIPEDEKLLIVADVSQDWQTARMNAVLASAGAAGLLGDMQLTLRPRETPPAIGAAVVTRTCSWCHTLTADRHCPACGHRADLCRLDCDCSQCSRHEPREDRDQEHD